MYNRITEVGKTPVPLIRNTLLSGASHNSDTFMARFTVSREVTGDAREGFPSCGLYMPGDNRFIMVSLNRAAGTGVPCDVCNNRPGRPGHGSIGCILLPAPGEAGITQHNHTQPGPGFPDDIRPGILSRTDGFSRVTGILCFSLGLLVNASFNVLAIWIALDAGCEKQNIFDKKNDEHLDAIIRAKLPKRRYKIRNR